MTYAELSAEQKAVLDAFMMAYRPTMGRVSQMLKAMANMVDAANAGVTDILDGLDVDAAIGDPTGLAGAQPLLKTQILSDIEGFETVLAIYDTAEKRQERIRAAGLANT